MKKIKDWSPEAKNLIKEEINKTNKFFDEMDKKVYGKKTGIRWKW
jgi:hypothetical protein